MKTVDWIILAAVLAMAVQGYFRGFVLSAMSMLGFVAGAVLGSRLAPLLLAHGSQSAYAALLALAGAVVGGLVLGHLLEDLGLRLRRALSAPLLRAIDGAAGAIASGALMLALAWVAGAALLQSASSLRLSSTIRSDVEHSRILEYLDSQLPPSGVVLHTLVQIDPLPSLSGPSATVPAPDSRIVTSAGARGARASIVRILGTACGLQIEGSGWVGADGLVLTAAHVVAGERATTVQVTDGSAVRSLNAEVVLYDSHNDIAVLRVSGPLAPALTLATATASGSSGAILGYPEDGPYTAVAARIGATELVASDNAYGRPTVRLITALRGVVRPGNSGGPVVAGDGRVLAGVFAEVTDSPKGKPEGFAVPASLLAADLAKARTSSRAVSTEGCVA